MSSSAVDDVDVTGSAEGVGSLDDGGGGASVECDSCDDVAALGVCWTARSWLAWATNNPKPCERSSLDDPGVMGIDAGTDGGP